MPLHLRPILRQLAFQLLHPHAPRGFPDGAAPELAGCIRREFAVLLEDFELQADAFWNFKATCGYAAGYTSYMGRALLNQKLLEHFVSLELLRPRAGELWIDIGSAASPFADYVAGAYNCKTYSLDLAYPTGIHGNKIGAGADRIPLPDAGVDALTLHCTIDHFEGDRDTRFIREAARILKPGGRLCILPVYFAVEPTNVCDPACFSPCLRFDPGARVHGARGYANRFGRFYSTETFRRRLLDAAPPLHPTLYHITGEQPLIPENYLHYALVLRKPDDVEQSTAGSPR